MQYFYKDNKCQAVDSKSENCICWYNEGEGPHPEYLPTDDDDSNITWRPNTELPVFITGGKAMDTHFCNKIQSNRVGQCCDCHCGPAMAEVKNKAPVITADEKRIVQKNIKEHLERSCVMSRASLDIIQRLLDAA